MPSDEGEFVSSRWRWPWIALAVAGALSWGSACATLRGGADGSIPDFFQEYASARNWLAGLPVYASHSESIPRYLGHPMARSEAVVVNAHPPASVLLAIPLAPLRFPDAFLIWNLISLQMLMFSLWLIGRVLRLPLQSRTVAAVSGLMLWSSPLWFQMRHGQLNLLLLVLVVGAWASERGGRPRQAGILLGAAAAIKLFPAFLILHYAIRRRWAVVAAAAATGLLIVALAIWLLGIDAHVAYFRDVLPSLRRFRPGWKNASLEGFWSRLLDPLPAAELRIRRTRGLAAAPSVTRILAAASSVLIVAGLAYLSNRRGRRLDGDFSFGAAVIAMLLVSPITWPHYFLLLLMPLAICWCKMPPSPPGEAAFALVFGCLWLNPEVLWSVVGLGNRPARPPESLLVLSCQCYALLGLLAICILTGLRLAPPHDEGRVTPAGASDCSA